ncbi:MAG: hypothetical protein JWQ21_3022 [Herminiimonas sp.]|nr:hypothetical protein [Herminiimonas sp.]
MNPTIKNLMVLPSKICSRFIRTSREISLSRYFSQRRLSQSSKDVVLVQCVEDLYYFGLFGQIISSLREQRPIRAEQFVLKSLRVGESRSVIGFLVFRLFINRSAGRKWVGLYNSFCDGVGYRSMDLSHPIDDVIDLCRSIACWRKLSSKEMLPSLVIDSVPVGDLINDSFLRFKPAPTVDIKDVYLLLVIWQTYRDVRRAKNYFVRIRPVLYLTSYSTYIQHGIAVRVALQCGVRVYSFGNYQQFSKELSVNDWMHTTNPDTYARDFLLFENQEKKLAEAADGLATRMAGGIDSATAYMKKSAYVESSDAVPDVRGALVIFLHDFFDSPHVYRDMVFPDFWEWICFTIDTLKKAHIPFFIKPHPNQISLSDGVLTDLKHRYPDVSIISPGITNKQLANAGLTCAVTVYGTVAHEMAYLGVPSIACANHPHVSFQFCKTAKSKSDYADALLKYADTNVEKSEMRRQSLIFYYMHNLNQSAEDKAFRDAVSRFRNCCHNPSVENMGPSTLLSGIATLPGFKYYISSLIETPNDTDRPHADMPVTLHNSAL